MYAIITIVLLALVGIFAAAYISINKTISKALEDFAKQGLLGKSLFLVMFSAAVLYGGSKAVSSFTFETGLRDNGSYSTNDTVVVAWAKDGSVAIPNDSLLYIDAREHDLTNDTDWVSVYQGLVGDYTATFTQTGATNYDYNVYYEYVAPPPVHTNGIWAYQTIRHPRREEDIAVRKAVVLGDGEIITPKKQEN